MSPKRVLAALGALVVLTSAGDAPPVVRMPDPATMQPYVLTLLVRGPEWTPGRTPHSDSVQAAHLANIGRMYREGYLLGAGPFAGDGRLRGVLLFRDLPSDSIRPQLVQDPAIRSGRLMAEMYRWYAPRGIGAAYEARAKARPDNPDSMIVLPFVLLKRPLRLPPADSLTLVRANVGHAGHTLDMLLDGRLLAAGPFFGDQEYRGLSVFASDTATARKLVLADPAVRAGRLDWEMHRWWVAWGVMPPVPAVREARP